MQYWIHERKLTRSFHSLCDANCHRLVWQLFIQFNNIVEMPNTSTNVQPSKKIRFTFPVENNKATASYSRWAYKDTWAGICSQSVNVELKCDLNIHHCHLLFCLSKKPFSCKAFFHFFILYWITRNEESQKVCSNIPTKCEVRLKHLKVCKIRQYFPLLMVLPANCWYLTTGSAGPWAGRRGVKELCQLQCSGPRAGIQSLFPSFPCTRMKTREIQIQKGLRFVMYWRSFDWTKTWSFSSTVGNTKGLNKGQRHLCHCMVTPERRFCKFLLGKFNSC